MAPVCFRHVREGLQGGLFFKTVFAHVFGFYCGTFSSSVLVMTAFPFTGSPSVATLARLLSLGRMSCEQLFLRFISLEVIS